MQGCSHEYAGHGYAAAWPMPGVALRLITCAGRFDAAARSYWDKAVVFASAVPTSRWASPNGSVTLDSSRRAGKALVGGRPKTSLTRK